MDTPKSNTKAGSEAKKAGNDFIVHGSILAIASILVRIIGLLYRIPMVRVIGTEGSSYYSSAYKIYSIMLLVSSYSMPLAVSKLVSARIGKKQFKDAYNVLRGAFLFALFVGGTTSLIVFFFADQFATIILNMPMAATPLRILAPAIFIMSFLGVYRGFFQGMSSMIPTALSQIFEQLVNAVVSVAMSCWLFSLGHRADLVKGTTDLGASLGAGGGTLGTTMGALTALIFCIFVYILIKPQLKRKIRKDKRSTNEGMPVVMKALVMTIFPVLISTTAYNLIDIVDQSVFSYYMSAKYSLEEYSLVWGAYDNMYILMIHVPVAVASALASSAVPAITGAVARRDKMDVIRKIKGALRFAMLVAIPCAIGLGVLATPIMNTLFGANKYHEEAALYLMMGCISVVFFSLATVTNGLLQGLGRMAVPVRHALIALVVHLIVMVPMLWLLDMHVYGVIFSYILFGMVMSTLNIITIDNLLGIHQDFLKTYVLPFAASLIMGGAVLVVSYFTTKYLHSEKLALVFGMAMGCVVYGVLLFGLRIVNEEDLREMPKGATIIRLAKKIHFL